MKSLTSKDYIWSFIAQIVSVCSGLITLPLILHFLSPDEIALNYILMSVTALIALFDFGFSSQFSRNFAYIFGGSQEILSVGVKSTEENVVNYRLLKTLIQTAKRIYTTLSVIVLVLLLTLGCWYISKVTSGFKIIDNILYIWILYSIALGIDFYFKYYTPLLMGKGLIKETKQIVVFSTFIRSIVVFILLILNAGLWSIVIAMVISTIFARYLSVIAFSNDGIIQKLNKVEVSADDIKLTFKKLWYNAKRLGIVGIATYTSMQLGLFYSGLFLSLQDVAAYGLLLQLVTLIVTISTVPLQISLPYISSLRVKIGGEKSAFEVFKQSLGFFYILYFLGALFLIFIVPLFLDLIHSNTNLPSLFIICLFLFFKYLEAQHCNCSMFLCTKNIIYDFESAVVIAFLNIIGLFLVLKFTSLGILGVVLVQGLVGLFYPNWKWPVVLCKENNINFMRLYSQSIKSVFSKYKKNNGEI